MDEFLVKEIKGLEGKSKRPYKLPDVRLTEEEYLKFQDMRSKYRHKDKSTLIRDLLFERKIEAVYKNESLEELLQEVLKLRTEIKKIGVNYNQMVRVFNSHNKAFIASKNQNTFIYLLGEKINNCNETLLNIANKLNKYDT